MAADFSLEKIRNIGIIAHIDAGKTTMSERVLFYTGVSYKIGEVHEGDTVMDWMEQERERGITITAAATTCFWTPTYAEEGDQEKKYRINIIDTPGHVDFTAEVERSLRVLDGGVVVFDGVAGVEPQSETVWGQAGKYKVPRICFINKLDRTGASFEKSFQSILSRLTKKAVRMQILIGEEEKHEGVIDLLAMKAYHFLGENGMEITEVPIPEHLRADAEKYHNTLVERIAEQDEKLTEDFLNGKEIPLPVLKATLRKAVIAIALVPVFTGSALKNKGVQLVLDGVVDYLPSPMDIPPVEGTHPETGAKETRKASDDEPFSGLVFKLQADPFVGQLSYFRVYSGVLKAGSYVFNATTGDKERIGRIVRMHANSREEVDAVYAGEIAAAVGLKSTKTSHTLCDEAKPIVLERIQFAKPVVSRRIEPKTKADQEKMGMALNRLSDEDPTFIVTTDPDTSETIISGMGELHLEVLIERMRREFGVDTNVGEPQVAYRETITIPAEAETKYIRQTGGRGQYGHVKLRVRPLAPIDPNEKKKPKNVKREEGFEFINSIKGGVIPQEYIPAVEKGVKEALTRGITAGFPVVDVSVELFDGTYHEVDSSEIAFKIAASMAFQDAARKAKPVLLEPIMRMEVVTPEKFMGDITGSLNSKRGQIESMDERRGEEMRVIRAKVPLAELFGYVTTLRSLTEGRASASMEFSHYAVVPPHVAESVIAAKG